MRQLHPAPPDGVLRFVDKAGYHYCGAARCWDLFLQQAGVIRMVQWRERTRIVADLKT